MKAKKILYSFLLVLFSLTLAVTLAVYFLIPESAIAQSDAATNQTQSGRPSFSGGDLPSMPDGSSGFSMPEGGFSFPSGETPDFSDGSFSFPDGEAPDGFDFSGSFPSGEGFPSRPDGDSSDGSTRPSRPDSGSSDGNGRRRPDSGSSDGTQTTDTGIASELETILPAWLFSAVLFVRQYWLWFLIGSATAVVLCIVRLIFLARKSRKLKAMRGDDSDDDSTSRRKIAVWPAILLLIGALVLVAVLFPADSTQSTNEAVAKVEVLSGTVEQGSLTETLIESGYLAEQEAETVTLPAAVKLSAVCVQNGETVTEGQIVAKVDKTSVMVAISDVEEAISDIDAQLNKAHDAVGKTTLSAAASGTVKQVYAKVGDDASDVMAEYGSLLLLSLDGRMSVELPAEGGPSADSVLYVMLSDGTVVPGEITDRSEETVTVSVLDQNYPIGETVSVSDENGTLYGSGKLFVHRPLNVTQYLGTVTRIYREEGAAVAAGTVLIGLSDASDTANYRTLLEQRAEYETELKTLFELYQNEVILAPADGVVSGISEDVPYQTVSAILGSEPTVRRLATSPMDASPADYVHYVGQVTGNAGGTLSLNISATGSISDYTNVSAIAGVEMSMPGTYTIASSVPVYSYTGSWGTIPASSIAAGDLLVFAFDENGTLVWVICYPGAAPTPTPTPTPDPSATPAPSADPSGEPASPQPSGQAPGPGGGHGGGGFNIPSGRGGASSTPEPAYRIAEQTLLSVTPQQTMLLNITVDELDVLSVSVGQSVSVYLDALSGTHFVGTVTEIDYEGVNSGGNTKYTVTVALARTGSMLPGMNGTVVISGETHDNALLIPVAALYETGNSVVVYRGYDPETDELLDPVPVTTGFSDGTKAEILSGLSAGDVFWYRYADTVFYTTGTTEQ